MNAHRADQQFSQVKRQLAQSDLPRIVARFETELRHLTLVIGNKTGADKLERANLQRRNMTWQDIRQLAEATSQRDRERGAAQLDTLVEELLVDDERLVEQALARQNIQVEEIEAAQFDLDLTLGNNEDTGVDDDAALGEEFDEFEENASDAGEAIGSAGGDTTSNQPGAGGDAAPVQLEPDPEDGGAEVEEAAPAAEDGSADDGSADDGAPDNGSADGGAADDGAADDGAADEPAGGELPESSAPAQEEVSGLEFLGLEEDTAIELLR